MEFDPFQAETPPEPQDPTEVSERTGVPVAEVERIWAEADSVELPLKEERAGDDRLSDTDSTPAVTDTTAPLPQAVREIWGDDPTAPFLIAAWGLDRFLSSAIHRVATYEHERSRKLQQLRAVYLKAAKAHK